MPQQKEASLIPHYKRMLQQRDVTRLAWNRKEGTPAGWTPFEKASFLNWEAMIRHPSVSDIAALRLDDKVEKRLGKTDHLARPSLVARCTVDNDISFVCSVYSTGVPTVRAKMAR